jgi:hypothetical protein
MAARKFSQVTNREVEASIVLRSVEGPDAEFWSLRPAVSLLTLAKTRKGAVKHNDSMALSWDYSRTVNGSPPLAAISA